MTKFGSKDRDASASTCTLHLRTMDEIGIEIQKEVSSRMALPRICSEPVSGAHVRVGRH